MFSNGFSIFSLIILVSTSDASDWEQLAWVCMYVRRWEIPLLPVNENGSACHGGRRLTITTKWIVAAGDGATDTTQLENMRQSKIQWLSQSNVRPALVFTNLSAALVSKAFSRNTVSSIYVDDNFGVTAFYAWQRLRLQVLGIKSGANAYCGRSFRITNLTIPNGRSFELGSSVSRYHPDGCLHTTIIHHFMFRPVFARTPCVPWERNANNVYVPWAVSRRFVVRSTMTFFLVFIFNTMRSPSSQYALMVGEMERKMSRARTCVYDEKC